MFYDERIEHVKGKISRKAILMSLVISLVLGSIHLANIIRNAPDGRFFCFAILEVAVFIGALIALSVGFIRSKLHTKDERTVSEQNSFYNKAASVLIKYVLTVFAFCLPIAFFLNQTNQFADVGFGGVLYVLLFIVGIYVVYSFRCNDIYFNYSIMDSDRYYKSVFKNIGRLALYALSFLGVSFMSFLWLVIRYDPDAASLVIVIFALITYYGSSLFALALVYLLYSFLERSSYRSENLISKSTVISLGITILIYAVYTASVMYVDSTAISQAGAMQLVSLLSSFDTYIKFALLIFLTYFGYEYQRSHENKLLSAACLTILLSETLSVWLAQISGSLIFVFMPEIFNQEIAMINCFATLNVLIEDTSSIADVVGFVLIIFALVKDKYIHKGHRFAVLAFAVLGGIEIFLRTQVTVLQVDIYHFIVEISILLYLSVLVTCVGRRAEQVWVE